MIELLFSNPITFFIIFPGLLASITIHEFAHAWTADKLGDPTPRYQGRVTLDPRAHLDPLGVIAMLLTRFGWGRPVEFDPYNLKNPVRDTAIIALAGPASNMIVAGILALVLNLGLVENAFVMISLANIIFINVVLAIFNLVPVYPLDGSKIMLAVLPRQTAVEYDQFMHRYGLFILLALIFPWAGGVSPVSQLILPVINLVVSFLLV
jgi:Zn-dependent protease